ncbi:cytochrome P450 [Fodinicola acaciae]|uniref:cytochrome P450 n=1 Tax=Fodinicola acaciae TaxID=2681555 RepID=UPI0013D34C4A|nr:cytochrome P450 [Fodinicola acaciae]
MTQAPSMPVHMRRNRFDPDDTLAAMREQRPVHRISTLFQSDAWLVTRYDDVREVLGDAGRFSNVGRSPQAGQTDSSGFLLAYDPPDHTRLRRMLTPEFTVRRMERLRPRIEQIVADHLDAMAAAGAPVDLMQAFALPVPSLVICELLGVPYEDRGDFQRRSNARVDMSISFEERLAVTRESQEYMASLVAEQRKTPGDDLLGMLVRDHGHELTDRELTGIGDLLLLAGHETTANMLGLGTLLLLQHPDQLAQVRDNPGAAEPAVEELMRYLTIVHSGIPRTATQDTVIGGQRIEAGDMVVVSLPSANRDPSQGDGMDDFDVMRKAARHVAFGHGVHHCLGAPLARMEMRIAYPALFRRFPALRLAVPIEEVPFRSFSFVYGVSALPVAW